MINTTKYLSNNLLNFCAVYEHRKQIMLERSEYDLMTNSVKFMQQMTSALSKGHTSVCN